MNSIGRINKRNIPLIASLGVLAAVASTSVARAGVLENLERERALVIENVLNPDLTPEERHQKIEGAKARLVDLERMVLRDVKLKGRNTPMVRRAFENYDLTFMLHAATERKLSLTDNWLSQLGITTQSIMSGSIRRSTGAVLQELDPDRE